MSLLSALPVADIFDSFSGAINFIFEQREPVGAAGNPVGGLAQVWDLTSEHLKLSGYALAASLVIALPIGAYLGHRGTGEFIAVAAGNAGRAIPELVLIAFVAAFLGFGLGNLTIALAVLGIPPILTNTFVAVRQVDPRAIEAARGMGMSEFQVATRIELPLGVPTIMSGVRTSAVNIIATAAIAPLAGVVTLGDFIISRNVYGDDGVLAGAILVALLALIVELLLAGLQRLLTPRGIKVQRDIARANA